MRHIHFVGIGGIGMSGLAQILLRKGENISGSDIVNSPIIEKLKAQGAKIFLGHHKHHIKNADLVVYSSAVHLDNPEIQAALNKNIPVIKRAVMLARLMQDKIGIAVTGSHGKTTTTTLVFHLLRHTGIIPTASIGGISCNLDDNACLGDSKYFVAEADESDGTFLYYKPTYAIITNMDYEHLDYYRDLKDIIQTFKDFMNNLKSGGMLFACSDDKNIRQALKDYKKRFITFGLNTNADIQPGNIKLKEFGSQFNLIYKNKDMGRLELNVAGVHNVSNSLAVAGLGLELGISFKDIRNAFLSFKGVKRRFQIKYNAKDILLLDDYAHHPTEIKATLKAAKNLSGRRLVVIFQPHRYTRTKFLLDEFSRSFDLADKIFITDIYAASEEPIKGIDAKLLVEKIKSCGQRDVGYLPKEKIVDEALKIIRTYDLVITLGAGDIGRISDELAARLKK